MLGCEPRAARRQCAYKILEDAPRLAAEAKQQQKAEAVAA